MRRTLLLLTALLAAVALIASGCGDDDADVSSDDTSTTTGPTGSTPDSSPGGDPLDGRTFLSQSVTEDGADRPLADGTQIRLTFDDGTVGASAGCNSFGGDYSVDDGALVVTGGAMTEMGCDEDRMAQDEWLFALLGDGPTIALDGDELTVTSDGTVIVLLDEETANPDRELTGVRWELESIIDGTDGDGTASSVGVEAWIELADDGTFTVDLGCNTGSGSYTIEGERLVVAEIVSTRMACEGEAATVEGAMTATLEAGPTFEIDADQLSLRTDEGGLDFVAAA